MLELLNIGCGSTFHNSWKNIDIAPASPDVKKHDIRRSLPYPNSCFDACYTSHVLEHMTQVEAQHLITESYRVLKPQGTLRVVVPDLESIVRKYLETLEKVENGDQTSEPNYDWMMLELYDQTVRSSGGGKMAEYLQNPQIKNKEFVLSRIGREAELFWQPQANKKKTTLWEKIKSKNYDWWLEKIQFNFAKTIIKLTLGDSGNQALVEGWFRQSGEIHRWMYDRFSLRRLLEKSGFIDVHICQADESNIPDFNNYNLDILEHKVRKPDSLFMEGKKLGKIDN
ncbi:MAG: methyltransferase domain-containing protein [Trichodesmium sp.]